MLRFMPRNAVKRFPKLTARQATDRARKRGEIHATGHAALMGILDAVLRPASKALACYDKGGLQFAGARC